MEDPESVEKQENTGIGSASACRRTAAITARCAAPGTRASIFFAKNSYEEGWIAGSSPAMTLRTQCNQQVCEFRSIVSALLFTMNFATATCPPHRGGKI